ncbi:hypothetical protein CRG98_019986 [Punica granatum]|uniref:Retrotransposon Copia-like N-terminal domain-containing protein n=1 Tax=Punica granatum TaxID=22663 RepID=A0A2I0JTD3_PUNGR|nr:hypothetical protein CRG98_019986 [Punica granatum]
MASPDMPEPSSPECTIVTDEQIMDELKKEMAINSGIGQIDMIEEDAVSLGDDDNLHNSCQEQARTDEDDQQSCNEMSWKKTTEAINEVQLQGTHSIQAQERWQLYDQRLAEMRYNEYLDDFNTLHSEPVIDGALASVKAHADKLYTRNSYNILCQEMKYEAMYVVKWEKSLSDGPNDDMPDGSEEGGLMQYKPNTYTEGEFREIGVQTENGKKSLQGSKTSPVASQTTQLAFPFPDTVNVVNFFTLKLTENNYFLWETYVMSLVESLDLLGFLNGETVPPAKMVQRDGAGVKNPDYTCWVYIDQLVKSWIIRTLSEEVLGHAVGLTTAAWRPIIDSSGFSIKDSLKNRLLLKGATNQGLYTTMIHSLLCSSLRGINL